MIDLTIRQEQLKRTVQRARERDILIPTFAQMKDPSLIPDRVRVRLKDVGLWDITPLNLFRITWKNQPTPHGGGFGGVNTLELPKALTGVDARIIALVGKWFPTGAHKVGASFGCLVPRLVTGQFDPTAQKAVWPSTGNYCRGGAYDSALLACESIAILPEGMSRERFEWLSKVSGEVIATPGCESNVKEIFDKCKELEEERGDDIAIFNQFDEFGNHLWHYDVTGHAMEEVLEREMGPRENYRGVVLTTGSAGTIGCGDYLKEIFPASKVAASEALQCPTLLINGFGGHRIEGIGDKHIPWIHDLKNTDLVMAIDDEACMSVARLFNEPDGRAYLVKQGVPEALVGQLDLLGISGIANVLSSIKFSKWYELGENDIVLTVLTDSMELYGSRLRELREERGEYTELNAAADYHRYLLGCTVDYVEELGYWDRKRIHNLKYYTWVEQQGKTYEEIQAQWYDPDYWATIHSQVDEIDALIGQFNEMVGVKYIRDPSPTYETIANQEFAPLSDTQFPDSATAVIAIGGNSLIADKQHRDVASQWRAVQETCVHIADMIERGWNLVITHGNGPQVGFILRRNELAAHEMHTTPMDLIVADTQASIGYMIAQSLGNEFERRGIHRPIASVITRVLVDRDDPAFENPSKGIGGFTTEEKARQFEAAGWRVVEDAGRGWRRVIASPTPLKILELDAIRALLEDGFIVVAVGGGGIPVIEDENEDLNGVRAVIDKDRATSLLAQELEADLFLISTSVSQVALNYREPNQRWLDRMTAAEARAYHAEGHFKPGSMGPKIEAVLSFLDAHPSGKALITDPPNITRALDGESGTWIVA